MCTMYKYVFHLARRRFFFVGPGGLIAEVGTDNQSSQDFVLSMLFEDSLYCLRDLSAFLPDLLGLPIRMNAVSCFSKAGTDSFTKIDGASFKA